ncbi:MAG TPA: CBS domain-containing protein, partial [Ktedonobacterales bacterium]
RDGCALVVDTTNKLTGIIVGRDLRERGATDGGKPSLARDIATRNLVTARRRERLPVAVRRMVRAGVRQLPVVDADAAGALVGLLRRTDALAAFDRVESAAEAITAGSGQPPTAPGPSSHPTKRQG